MATIDSHLIDFEAEVDVKALERLLSIDEVDGKRRKAINNLIAKALGHALDRMQESTRALLPNDKRRAWSAIHRTLYKEILGGNINIFSRRKAGARATVPPSKRGRSATTERLESYLGLDRSFVLRIMNAGSGRRIASTMDGHPIRRRVSERPKRGREGYRSDILGYRGVWGSRNGRGPAAEGFFSRTAANAMGNAAAELSQLLCEEITKEINKY